MKRCPECGNPPAYTSFCTLCAQLFRVKPEPMKKTKLPKWHGHHEAMVLAVRLAFSQQLSVEQTAKKLGCAQMTIYRWRHKLGLFTYRRRPHALAP